MFSSKFTTVALLAVGVAASGFDARDVAMSCPTASTITVTVEAASCFTMVPGQPTSVTETTSGTPIGGVSTPTPPASVPGSQTTSVVVPGTTPSNIPGPGTPVLTGSESVPTVASTGVVTSTTVPGNVTLTGSTATPTVAKTTATSASSRTETPSASIPAKAAAGHNMVPHGGLFAMVLAFIAGLI